VTPIELGVPILTTVAHEELGEVSRPVGRAVEGARRVVGVHAPYAVKAPPKAIVAFIRCGEGDRNTCCRSPTVPGVRRMPGSGGVARIVYAVGVNATRS